MDKITENGIKQVQKRMNDLWQAVDETDKSIKKMRKTTKRYNITSYIMIALCSACFIMDLFVRTPWYITILPIIAVLANIGYLIYAHDTIKKYASYEPLPSPHDLDPLLDSLGYTKKVESLFDADFEFAKHRQIVADLVMFGINNGKNDDIQAVLYKYGLMEPVSVALINANIQNSQAKQKIACRAFFDLSNELEKELYAVDSPVVENDWAKDNVKWDKDAIGEFLKENKGEKND